jgi:hypothetical protein
MKTAVIVLLVLIGCWVLNRFGCWMERRGWIYWRKSRGTDGRLSQAFTSVHSLLEPAKRHILEVQEKEADHRPDAASSTPADDNQA